jgi:hypothetical protein
MKKRLLFLRTIQSLLQPHNGDNYVYNALGERGLIQINTSPSRKGGILWNGEFYYRDNVELLLKKLFEFHLLPMSTQLFNKTATFLIRKFNP